MGKEARVRKMDGIKRNYNDSWVNVSNVFRGPRGDKAFDCSDHNNVWKILLEMGRSDHLTCLLRNLYAGQEAMVRTGHGTTDWFQIGKGVGQGCLLSPCSFNLYAEYIMRNAGLEESRLPGEISVTSDMQMTPSCGGKRRTKEPLESERGE